MSYISPGAIVAVSSALPVLGIVAVVLRFAIRKTQNHGFGFDDWLILPALAFSIGIGIALLIGEQANAIGYPSVPGNPQLDTAQIILISKIELAVLIMQAISLGFAKLSIVCFYRRIFVMGSSKAFDIFTKVLLAVIVCWATAFSLCFLFACGSHVSAQWGAWTEVQKYCFNTEILDLFYVAADVAVDILLLIIPIPIIIRLQMSKTRRFAVTIIFALGALTVVTSIIRVVILSVLEQGVDSSLISSDRVFDLSIFFYWTMIEVGCAVIVACLPTFQVLFRAVSTETIFNNVRGIISLRSLRKQWSTGKSDSASDHNSANDSIQSQTLNTSTVRAKAEYYPMGSRDLEAQKYAL